MPQTTFSTPLGQCGLEWNDSGLTRFRLPDAPIQPGRAETTPASEQAAGAGVLSPRVQSAPVEAESDALPPAWIQAIIDRVGRHLTGDLQDFSDLPYDFTQQATFVREVLQATLAIKPGRTATYGQIAQAIGQPPAASRAVGSALGANPWPLLIPCHRIVAANGKMTGYSGPGGIDTKARLLALEGAQLL